MDRVSPQGPKPRTSGGSDGTAEAVPFPTIHSPQPIGDPWIIRALYLSFHV